MKEEVKFVYEEPLLVNKLKNNVYKETTTACPNPEVRGQTQSPSGQWWSSISARTRLVISVLGVVSFVAIVVVLVATGIHASNVREWNQNEQIVQMKDALETQQTRLHRMQKELQFLVSRQQANDARDESLRRRQIRPASGPNQDQSGGIQEPIQPEVATLAEEVIDIDQLPVAPANKRKGSKHGGSA